MPQTGDTTAIRCPTPAARGPPLATRGVPVEQRQTVHNRDEPTVNPDLQRPNCTEQ